jgi:hypothetical protein
MMHFHSLVSSHPFPWTSFPCHLHTFLSWLDYSLAKVNLLDRHKKQADSESIDSWWSIVSSKVNLWTRCQQASRFDFTHSEKAKWLCLTSSWQRNRQPMALHHLAVCFCHSSKRHGGFILPRPTRVRYCTIVLWSDQHVCRILLYIMYYSTVHKSTQCAFGRTVL